MMVREGLWSNTITLVNIIISGLVAFGFYSPLAIYLDEMLDGEYTYLLDFVTIWGLFVITMLVCRIGDGSGFRKRGMRFKNPIDPIGGPMVGDAGLVGARGVRHGHAPHLADAEGRLRRKFGLLQRRRRLGQSRCSTPISAGCDSSSA